MILWCNATYKIRTGAHFWVCYEEKFLCLLHGDAGKAFERSVGVLIARQIFIYHLPKIVEHSPAKDQVSQFLPTLILY